jgi:hypothetical protein
MRRPSITAPTAAAPPDIADMALENGPARDGDDPRGRVGDVRTEHSVDPLRPTHGATRAGDAQPVIRTEPEACLSRNQGHVHIYPPPGLRQCAHHQRV